jgi:hypothetical protein
MGTKLAKLFSFLKDDSPYSTMRTAVMLTIGLFIPAFVYQWTDISAKAQRLQDIPESVMWLLGVLLSGKVIQKGIEVAQNIISQKKEEIK